MRNDLVLVRGGGRIGTAVAHRLRLAGLPVVITEATRPTCVHRGVAFGMAIYESEITVDGVPARRAADAEGLRQLLERGFVPVLADAPALIRETVRPWALVDAIGLARNTGTRLTDAPIVIGVGAGFTPGVDVHVVVDSRPGHDLGRIVLDGPLTGGAPAGPCDDGVLRPLLSPGVGRFQPLVPFGEMVDVGTGVGRVGTRDVTAPVAGLVSGLLAEGHFVGAEMRVAEIDPRGARELLARIDPVARAVAGGVLEALLYTAAVGSAPGQALGEVPDEPGAGRAGASE